MAHTDRLLDSQRLKLFNSKLDYAVDLSISNGNSPENKEKMMAGILAATEIIAAGKSQMYLDDLIWFDLVWYCHSHFFYYCSPRRPRR